MIKKNIHPDGVIFYRVTYEVGIYDYFLDFVKERKAC